MREGIDFARAGDFTGAFEKYQAALIADPLHTAGSYIRGSPHHGMPFPSKHKRPKCVINAASNVFTCCGLCGTRPSTFTSWGGPCDVPEFQHNRPTHGRPISVPSPVIKS